MATATPFIAAGTAVAFAWSLWAQEPPSTVEQRLAALEAGLATLDTRLGLERARPTDLAGQTDLGLSARITELERAVDRLAADLQRVERLADSASRAAGQAQRDAERAEQTARDALLRAR
jgi:uncharacterized coiled-coil protein SlyX